MSGSVQVYVLSYEHHRFPDGVGDWARNRFGVEGDAWIRVGPGLINIRSTRTAEHIASDFRAYAGDANEWVLVSAMTGVPQARHPDPSVQRWGEMNGIKEWLPGG